MKVLITGGCGFIGSNLAAFMLEKGDTVKVFDNLSEGSRENLENATKGLGLPELIVGDVRDKVAVEDCVKGVDAVVHLAAHTDVVDSLERPEEDFQINAAGTLNVLEACRKKGVNRFVFASSNAVAGERDPPINEDNIPSPLSPYGASKLIGEALCSAYYHSYDIHTVSLRFSNVYGPFSSHKPSVISKFFKNISEGRPLTIYGDGGQTRDFIHTRDICEAVYLSLNANLGGEIFQIATGVETSIRDLVKMISKVVVAHGFEEPPIEFADSRKGEIIKNYSDISKARRVLGFDPKMGLEDGLRSNFDTYLDG